MNKVTSLGVAGSITAIALSTVFASPAMAVDSTISFSAATVCPGESVTFTANGVSDGSSVTLAAGEVAKVYLGSTLFSSKSTITTGTHTYQQLVNALGGTGVNLVQIDSTTPVARVVATASVDILTACVTPEPDPETPAVKTLPDTGVDANSLVATSAAAALVAAAGASLVVARRRKARA